MKDGPGVKDGRGAGTGRRREAGGAVWARAGALLGAGALLLAAASAGAATLVLRPEIALTGGGAVSGAARLDVGDVLVVVLPSQAGVGYSWEPRPADPARLGPTEAACPERRADGLVGAPAPACFAWRALAPGEVGVTLVYRRHWETLPEGVLRYDLVVTIAPGG